MPSILSRSVAVLSLFALVAEAAPVFAQTLVPAVSIRTSSVTQDEDWPADFNRDGIPDLAASAPSGAIQVRLGNGDGTFRTPIVSSTRGRPLATGDINRDGRVDVVAAARDRIALLILPGLGDGRLGTPRTVEVVNEPFFALLVDLDGDALLDLVSGSAGEVYDVRVSPGRGDLTFGAPIDVYTGGEEPRAGVAADVNADGLRDIIVAHTRYGVRLLLNRRNFSFDVSPIPHGSGDATDVAARDVTGDGRVDVVISGRSSRAFGPPWESGYAIVAIGRGDGTFAIGNQYPTAPGANSVVVGDFTHDGVIDIATANHSYVVPPESSSCGALFQGANSVSILPGRAGGAFGLATSFALGPQGPAEFAFGAGWGALNTADVNRDGFPDLLAGWGTILITAAPRTNRPPIVSAGDDYYSTWGPDMLLNGRVSDPDGHFLTVRWGGGSGGIFHVDDAPAGCYEAATRDGTQLYGPHTFQITASDGVGGTASDTVTITYPQHAPASVLAIAAPAESETLAQGSAYTIRWTAASSLQAFHVSAAVGYTQYRIPECENLPATARQCTWRSPGPIAPVVVITVRGIDGTGRSVLAWTHVRIEAGAALPSGWTSRDIGAVAAAGSTGITENRTFTVTGSGADIWGSADEFQYAYTSRTGDFEIVARVRTIQNVHRWTKAGLMIRDGTDANARNASVFVTPTTANGIVFQRRTTAGGSTAYTAGASLTTPVWLRLSRSGSTVRAYSRSSSEPWTLIGTQSFSSLPATLLVGLAVTSHADGELATATFDGITVTDGPFQSRDIGAVGLAGRTSVTTSGVTIEGSGADIWGTADAFRYYYRAWTGDGRITVRVNSIENTHVWAKAGVMFRESLAANAKNIMALVSPGRGVVTQYRGTTGGASATSALASGTAPEWLRLTRTGNLFVASVSEDGETWRTLASLTLPMTAAVYVGLPVTSHNNSTLATAAFDGVEIAP